MMNISGLINLWNTKLVRIKLKISFDLSLLTEDIGYASGRVIHYNSTWDTIFVDENVINRVMEDYNSLSQYIDKSLCEIAIKEYVSEYDSMEINKDVKSYQNKIACGFLTLQTMQDIEKTIDYKSLGDYLSKNRSNIISDFKLSNMNIKRISDNLYYLVDWESTFSVFSNIELIELIKCISSEFVFTLPTDFRYLDNIRKQFPSIADLKPNLINIFPMFYFFEQVKFIDDELKSVFDGYINDLTSEYVNIITRCDESNSKVNPSRTPMCYLIQKMKECIGKIFEILSFKNEKILYMPYNSGSFFTKGLSLSRIRNDSNEAFISIIEPVVDFLFNGNGNGKDNKSFSVNIRNLIRSTLACSDIKFIDDISLKFPTTISQTMLDYYKNKETGKNYGTGCGFSYRELSVILDWYENYNYIETKFDRGYLNKMMFLVLTNNSNKNNDADFNEYSDCVGDEIIVHFTSYIRKKGFKRISELVVFLNWVKDYSGGRFIFNLMSDFEPSHFYNPLDESINTFYRFIDTNGYADSVKTTKWSTIYSLFDDWAKDKSRETGLYVKNPVAQTKSLFLYSADKYVTDRDSMPSKLHEICLEVLQENDYGISNKCLPKSSNQYLKNNLTDEFECVDEKTAARCLDLLLNIPLRFVQARWLDQGFMDSKIWDMKLQQYVENKHPLRDYKYRDGKDHNEKFGNTGLLLVENQSLGNDDLAIYVNTNKTSARRKKFRGYKIPWPYNSGISSIDHVWDIIKDQIDFNEKYSPEITMPVHLADENRNKYNSEIWSVLPNFTPLFRRIFPSVSQVDANKYSIYLPITYDSIRKLFYAVLTEAEVRYLKKYPHRAGTSIVFDVNGEPLYDIHSLRVFGVTNLLEDGVSLEIVQMIVGHSVATMTLYYNKIRNEILKKKLIEAKKNHCNNPHADNVKNIFSTISSLTGEDLIALYDLVEEWHFETREKNIAPNLSGRSFNRTINGGICAKLDCKNGGINITFVKSGQKITFNAVDGGDFRCGNCRYWCSHEYLISEQIYHLNLVAQEIFDLSRDKNIYLEKAQKCFDDAINDSQYVQAEHYELLAENNVQLLGYRVKEYQRRKLMLKASLDRAFKNRENKLITNNENFTFDSIIKDNNLVSGQLNEFENALELTIQSALLKLPVDINEVSMRKLDLFSAKLLNVAGEAGNPLLFIPTDNVKRIALAYSLVSCCEKIGRPFTNEEFADPRLLLDTIDIETVKLAVSCFKQTKNDGLLE